MPTARMKPSVERAEEAPRVLRQGRGHDPSVEERLSFARSCLLIARHAAAARTSREARALVSREMQRAGREIDAARAAISVEALRAFVLEEQGSPRALDLARRTARLSESLLASTGGPPRHR
jgi:hypothetical protein